MLLEKGKLLVAKPSILGDIAFTRTVIFLAEHSNEGSLGFILNKPLNYTLQDLLPEIEVSFVIYNGGPVEQDNLYFIHTIPEIIPNSIEIADGIFWGADFEDTKLLLNQGKITKNEIRFFLGYSGWSSNQLQQEINDDAWVITQNNFKKKLFSTPSSQLWKNKMETFDDDLKLFANAPENPNLN